MKNKVVKKMRKYYRNLGIKDSRVKWMVKKEKRAYKRQNWKRKTQINNYLNEQINGNI